MRLETAVRIERVDKRETHAMRLYKNIEIPIRLIRPPAPIFKHLSKKWGEPGMVLRRTPNRYHTFSSFA